MLLMPLLKKYCKANSILESVIALAIISTCIYIALMVYANVFSPKNSIAAYGYQNQIQEVFFNIQCGNEIENSNININNEWLNTHLKKITIEYQDSLKNTTTEYMYIYGEEN